MIQVFMLVSEVIHLIHCIQGRTEPTLPSPHECTRGKPLPNVLCDDVNWKCPSGYQCNEIHGICCPGPCLPEPCPPPPTDACTEPLYKIIDGVKCPWCWKFVPCKKICPAVPANSICKEYTRECKDDSSCTVDRKCCRKGCSYVCVYPVSLDNNS